MTAETQKKIVAMLYVKNSHLFFDKLKPDTVSNLEKTVFMIEEVSPNWDSIRNEPQKGTYELKDEFKKLLSNMSLTDIMQILPNTTNNEVKVIKGWVTFIGVVLLISIIVTLIVALNF